MEVLQHVWALGTASVSESSLLEIPSGKLKTLLESVNPLLAAAANKRRGGAAASGKNGNKKQKKTNEGEEGEEEDGEEAEEEEEEGEEEMDDEEAAERSARALEAALLLMNVVTVPKMPAELLSEDACEHVLSIAKRSLANMHKSLMEGGSFDAATTITPKKAPPPPAVRS